ncbi:MAG: hypothetical protein H6561_01610 [Lewinellaceae bacterium]|nr:hypothetical protein [Lewinellaceae bacterium]
MLKAVEYNPYLDLAHFNLAHVELMLGKYDLAIESSDKAKQLNPFSPLLFMSKARVLRDANHYSEALSEFEASLKDIRETIPYFGNMPSIMWSWVITKKRSACWKNAPWARLTGSMVIAMVN